MRKYNYHTHSVWCKHASGSLEEIILEAIDKKLDVLGMSPHMPYPKDKYLRMTVDEFPMFYQEYQNLREKYSSQIELRLGIEAEYFPQHFDFMDEIDSNYDIDYYILGHHFALDEDFYYGFLTTRDKLKEYVETLIDALNTRKYTFLAHPDVFSISYPYDDELVEWAAHQIFSTCEKLDIPVEFNANGIRRGKVEKEFGNHYAYPWDSFWKHAKNYDLKVLVNSDNHATNQLYDEFVVKAHELAKTFNLNVVDDYQ